MSIKIDTKQLDAFADKLMKASTQTQQEVTEKALNILTSEVLSRTVKQTPRDTSNLARSWKASDKTARSGNTFYKTVFNSAEYSVYVEYGHRTRGPHIPENEHKTTENNGWVPGFFMLTRAIEDVDKMKNSLLSGIVNKYFSGLF